MNGRWLAAIRIAIGVAGEGKSSGATAALNEEAAIGRVIEDLQEVFRKAPWTDAYEIIVADNGSTDRTAQVDQPSENQPG